MTISSAPTADADEVYDARTVIFHWLTALLVALQWTGAHYIDAFPKGPLRIDARSTHIALGVALVAVLIARAAWRTTRGRRLMPASNVLVRLISGPPPPCSTCCWPPFSRRASQTLDSR